MVQPFQQQDRDQGCPNLDAQGVFASAHEALYFEILLERLEKQLELPPVLVDGGNGRGAERQQVGQQYDLPFVHRIPDHHAPQKAGAILLSLDASKADQLVRENVAVLRNRARLHHFVRRVLLQTCDKVDFLSGPLAEQRVVVIPAIHRHDGTGVESEGVGHLHITAFGFGDQHVARQVIVVVQQNVSLDAALGTAKLGPRKKRQAQRDGGRVEREQFVLETELLLALPQSFFVAGPGERGEEQILVQLGGPVLVGIGKGGFIGGLGDTEMNQLAQATAQAVANLAQRIGVGELAEQHRYQLRPAAKTFGAPFRIVFLDQRRELGPREMMEQLIQETRILYDGFAFLVGAFGEAPAKEQFANVHYRRAFLLLTGKSNLFWTRVGQDP